MMYNLLPKFKVVEVNSMAALRMGHIIAQAVAKEANVATKQVNGAKFLENGIIVGLDKNGEIRNFDDAIHAQPCLVYTEELVPGAYTGLDLFAEPIVDGICYPRLLPLYLGDAFTTDNCTGSGAYATVVDGQLNLTDTATGAIFAVKEATLPNGKSAYEFTYVGLPMANA